MISLERTGDALRFTGALSRAGVATAWKQALPLLAGGVRRFELVGVSGVDSAGIALLAELAARCEAAPVIEGDPPGLAELRAAYRLSPTLAFAST